MTAIGQMLLEILRNGWIVLVSAVAAVAALALMSQILKTVSSGIMGANLYVYEAIAAFFGVLLLALFGLLGVPALVQAAQASLPPSAGCGPITELGQLAIMLIGGLAAVRMMLAVFSGVAMTTLGGSGGLSEAMLEAGEAIFGMVIASAALPIATHLLGVC
ncbi:MAG: hypothetical protein U9Q82_06310 [Chloroflexota bacterium]|nr:hypothetical protein [Chloroflexota bacterium]